MTKPNQSKFVAEDGDFEADGEEPLTEEEKELVALLEEEDKDD